MGFVQIALTYMKRALSLLRMTCGETHHEVAAAYMNVGSMLQVRPLLPPPTLFTAVS